MMRNPLIISLCFVCLCLACGTLLGQSPQDCYSKIHAATDNQDWDTVFLRMSPGVQEATVAEVIFELKMTEDKKGSQRILSKHYSEDLPAESTFLERVAKPVALLNDFSDYKNKQAANQSKKPDEKKETPKGEVELLNSEVLFDDDPSQFTALAKTFSEYVAKEELDHSDKEAVKDWLANQSDDQLDAAGVLEFAILAGRYPAPEKLLRLVIENNVASAVTLEVHTSASYTSDKSELEASKMVYRESRSGFAARRYFIRIDGKWLFATEQEWNDRRDPKMK